MLCINVFFVLHLFFIHFNIPTSVQHDALIYSINCCFYEKHKYHWFYFILFKGYFFFFCN